MLSPPKFGSMNGSQMAWKEERIAKLKEINLFKKKSYKTIDYHFQPQKLLISKFVPLLVCVST